MGEVYTSGPTRGPEGEILANVITFHYEAEAPEPVHLLIGEKRVKTVMVEGEVNWRIEVVDGKVKISGDELILDVPVSQDGILNSEVAVNESKQMFFDISVGDAKVFRIECPKQLIGAQP